MSRHKPWHGESMEPPPLPVGTVTYKTVVGYPGYAIGNDGSVLGCRRCRIRGDSPKYFGKWRILKGGFDQDGYRTFGASRDGKRKTLRICQQVLIAFVGPCPPGLQCRHLDGDNKNDRLGNLAWGTVFQNAQDRVKHGTCSLLKRGAEHPRGKLTDQQVKAIIEARARGVGRKELASRYQVTPKYITQICGWGGRDTRDRKERKKWHGQART